MHFPFRVGISVLIGAVKPVSIIKTDNTDHGHKDTGTNTDAQKMLEEIKKLRGFVGGGAVDRVLREFQNVINKEFDDFSANGFSQWHKENTGMYNDP